MTADTTFKEFVEEEGLSFFLLEVGSRRYRNFVEKFNEAKHKLRAEEEARLYQSVRPLLILDEQSAKAELESRHAEPPKSGARFAGSQP
jgi:hypothetical protein